MLGSPLVPSFFYHPPSSPRYLELFSFCDGGEFCGEQRGGLVPKVRRCSTKAADRDRNYPPTFKVEALGLEVGPIIGQVLLKSVANAKFSHDAGRDA